VNLQLDHFSDDFHNHKTHTHTTHTLAARENARSHTRTHTHCVVYIVLRASLENGPNNVSRWMTWLPISLKNAAKCDKWYQLQNHSITESLNAKGAWEKLFTSHPRACRISVSNKKPPQPHQTRPRVFLVVVDANESP
jgi:hypothetical protein